MNPLENQHHRLEVSVRIERVAGCLADLNDYWIANELPPNLLTSDEYPFRLALEDQVAETFAAANRIRTRTYLHDEHRLVKAAREMRSEDGENPEYDRALVELIVEHEGLSQEVDGPHVAHLLGLDYDALYRP